MHSIAGMGLFLLLCSNLRWLSYNRFSGAEFVNVSAVGAVWIVPCDLEVNLTFKIGGVRYPIHPFDATLYVSGFSVLRVNFLHVAGNLLSSA